jgi:anti-sigma factor RsiW
MLDNHDARLIALLDGALSDAEATVLRAEIAGDPALQARLAELDVDFSDLPAQADDLLAAAPPMPNAQAGRGSLVQLAAAACVALALVLGGVLLGSRAGGSEDWRDFAAAYHLLYQPETLAAPIQGDGGVALVSEALGRDLSALVEVEGLDFRRAQILGWQDETLIQFAYVDATGRPVAVCVMALDGGSAGAGLASEERHGLATTSFYTDALQILVIAPDGEMDTDALSQRLAARL